MSCLSKANLQMTVGVGVPAFSGHPFKKLSVSKMITNLYTVTRRLSLIGTMVFLSFRSCLVTASRWFAAITCDSSLI